MRQEKPNSISFGPVNYDKDKHVLRTQGNFGDTKITCSITEDALKEVYFTKGGEKECVLSFKQHEPQIQKAVMKKIQLKEWRVPNKEILLNGKDLRQYGE